MYIRFHIYCTIGLADFQVLPPGLNVIDHKGLQVEPNDFQLRGTYQFTAVCVCVCMCVYVCLFVCMYYRSISIPQLQPLNPPPLPLPHKS